MPPDHLLPYTLPGGDLPLSAQALLELMEGVLARGRPFRFCARGASMLPFIQNGDVLCVAPLGGHLPGLGQVIAYRQGNQTSARVVVHRITWRAGAGWHVQGDNLSGVGVEWVPQAQILGVVTAIERCGRAIRLGLGPERYLIALLARAGLLALLTRLGGGMVRRVRALGKTV